jgi:hypothetical protein
LRALSAVTTFNDILKIPFELYQLL